MLRVAGVSHLLVAVPHFVAITRDIRCSVASRLLTFAPEPQNRRKDAPQTHQIRVVPGTSEPKWSETQVQGRLVRLKTKLLTIYRQYFDASGEFFEVGFCVRQGVEIGAQTYQAYLFSSAVPTVRFNQVLVLLLVFNCVYAPLLTKLLQRKPGSRRAAVLGVDLVIDLAVSVVIPLSILVPHMVEFDWINKKYPDELRFNHLWMTRALSEVRQTMVTSPLDFISSLVPHVAALDSLSSLKVVLLRMKNESSDRSMEAIDKTLKHPLVDLAQSKARVVSIVDRIAVIWAIAVAITQLQAELRPSNAPTAICSLPMKPWFAHNMSCAVIDINCHRTAIRGSSHDITSLLGTVDRESLMKLHFSHCPDLHIPSIVTEFSLLIGLQTLNCSLSDWAPAAALNKYKQPVLAEVYMYNTNLTEFPVGLLQGALPSRLSFVLHTSNLTKLPDNFGSSCKDLEWTNFYLEHVPLVSLPESFKQASISSLTLFDTLIQTIPDDLFSYQRFTRLRLSQNSRLSKLPSDVGSLDGLNVLYVEHTNVSELPAWFDSWYKTKLSQTLSSKKTTAFVSFYGSPICSNGSITREEELCESVGSVEAEDHRYAVVQKLGGRGRAQYLGQCSHLTIYGNYASISRCRPVWV